MSGNGIPGRPGLARLAGLATSQASAATASSLSSSPSMSSSLLSLWSSRVAKCHEYDGYIRVKIFRGWGKKSERTHNMTKLGLF